MLLEIQNLSKVYKKGNSLIKANDNISFSLNAGEILGILGPNGAGKTTLIKQIATLLVPDEGEILYRGVSLVKHPNSMKGQFSFLLEGMRNVYHYLTGEANLLYFAYLNHIPTLIAKKRSDNILQKMGLYDVKDDYVFTYSSGMNKKLGIATCLINDPEMIFLDEPLSGLDVLAAEDLIDSMKIWVSENKKTFIVASHRMDFIERVTNRVLWMKDGRIVMKGNTDDMKNFSSQEKEFILYLRNSDKARRKLQRDNLKFQVLSNTTLKLYLSLSQKELFYSILSDFELLNLEKKESDFEAIFKELYYANDN